VQDLTLEDIGKIAGVSRSTVSRVVNNNPNVSDDVRERVLDVIQTTGYHPNVAARTLASQRSWMIGEDEDKIFPRISRKGFLDGIVVQVGHKGDQMIDRLLNSNIPFVVAGRPFQSKDVSYIDIDNVTAAYNAVSHLIRLGYKRIGTIAGAANSTAGLDRKEGYLKALHERGQDIDGTLMIDADFTEASGYYAMQHLLAAKPDAVFVASDIMAIGAMRAVHDSKEDVYFTVHLTKGAFFSDYP